MTVSDGGEGRVKDGGNITGLGYALQGSSAVGVVI